MLRPLQYDAGLGLDAGKGDRLVQQRLVLHDAAGLEPAARRKDQFRSCVLDSGSEFLGGKTAEHDRVHRPDPRAGQHRDHRFRHHRHIKDDAVALGDAEIGHHSRERFHFMQHLGVGQFGDDAAGQRRIVDQRHLVAAPTSDMAVERVVAGVDHGAGEPAPILAHGGIEHLFRRLDPVDFARRLGPKALGIGQRTGMDLVIPAALDIHGVCSHRPFSPLMPGIVPGIHVLVLVDRARRGWPGRARP